MAVEFLDSYTRKRYLYNASNNIEVGDLISSKSYGGKKMQVVDEYDVQYDFCSADGKNLDWEKTHKTPIPIKTLITQEEIENEY